MTKIADYEGHRTRTGYHTGYAMLRDEDGVIWIAQESGTRRATKKDLERLTGGTP